MAFVYNAGMTIKEYLAANGPDATARKMVDMRLSAIVGLGIDDLSDTCQMADAVESVSVLLSDGDIKAAISEVKAIDISFVEDNEFC